MTVASVAVPRPPADADTLTRAEARVARAASEVRAQAGVLESAGRAVLADWEGQAASAFAAQLREGVTRLQRTAQAHDRSAGVIRAYRARVAETTGVSRRAAARVDEATRTHNVTAVGAVQVLTERIARLRQDASERADKAVSDLAHFNIVGAVEEGARALSDAAQAAADDVELLAHLGARLDSWCPMPLEAALRVQRVDEPVRVWDAGSVQSDLEDAGGFLVSTAVGGLERFLALVDGVVDEAVGVLRRAEDDVSERVAAAQRLVADAWDGLGRAAARAEAELERDAVRVAWTVGRDADAAWRGAQEIGRQVGRDVTVAAHVGEEWIQRTTDEIGATVEHDWDAMWDGVRSWVRDDPDLFRGISTGLGIVSTVAAFASLIPGVDAVALPVTMALLAAKAGTDSALAAAGEGKWSAVADDGVDAGLFFLGGAAGAVTKGLNEAPNLLRGADDAEAAVKQAAADERVAQDAADAATDPVVRAAHQADADAAHAQAELSQAREGALREQAKAVKAHPWRAQGRAFREEGRDLAHPVETSRSALGSVRESGGFGRHAVSNWKDATSGKGLGVFAVNSGIQADGAARDAESTGQAVRVWMFTGRPAQ